MSKATPTTERLIQRLPLPSFPSVALQAMNTIESEAPALSRLSDIINTDAMLAAAVLRASNSALFHHSFPVRNIETAIQLLGMDRTTLLVLTHATWQLLSRDVPPIIGRRWWRHNFVTALFAEHLGEQCHDSQPGYLPGLMHSIGQLALYQSFPTDYLRLVSSPVARLNGLFAAERNELATDHCQLGAALLSKWKLPPHVIDAAAHHHLPHCAESSSTHLIHPSCLLANATGFTVFPDQPGDTDSLPESAQTLLGDHALCAAIAYTVATMESQLFPHS